MVVVCRLGVVTRGGGLGVGDDGASCVPTTRHEQCVVKFQVLDYCIAFQRLN